MLPDYSRITGQNLERVAALSDGIFAVAMTPQNAASSSVEAYSSAGVGFWLQAGFRDVVFAI
jgi:hypothetical protein